MNFDFEKMRGKVIKAIKNYDAAKKVSPQAILEDKEGYDSVDNLVAEFGLHWWGLTGVENARWMLHIMPEDKDEGDNRGIEMSLEQSKQLYGYLKEVFKEK